MKRSTKTMAALCLCAGLALPLFGCSTKGTTSSATSKVSSAVSSTVSKMTTLTDTAGNRVKVPQRISHIADAATGHAATLMVLGAGSKVVAATNDAKNTPLALKMNSAFNTALTTTARTFDATALKAKKPDVYFATADDPAAKAVQKTGVPVVAVGFKNFDQMGKAVTTTATALGGDAPARAKAFNSYTQSTVNNVKSTTSQIPENEKLRVLHLSSTDPIKVDGGDTIVDEWIKDAGGVNAAQGVTGDAKEVSLDQVKSWNPDVIIIGNTGEDGAKKIREDSNWAGIKAVQTGKVYNNPVGTYAWDRYTPESVLQVQWAAKTLYPDRFTSLDMNQAVKDYYKKFMNYDISDADVQTVLNPQKA